MERKFEMTETGLTEMPVKTTQDNVSAKMPEREEVVWSDEAFLEGWNSVYNTEEPKPADFIGRNRRALQMPGANEKLQQFENSEARLFLEGFYDVDGAINDWEREERMAQVDESLLNIYR